MDDRTLGIFICVAAPVLLVYYTVWLLVTPFVEEGHAVLNFFPDRLYAILIPAYAGVCLVSVVALFLGSVLLKHKPKKKRE